jgi:transposase-like protein
MPRRIIQKSDTVMVQAITDYQNRSLTTEAIAAKHGISTATLTVWAKKAGLELRQRGRKPQSRPTPRQLEIVKLASVYRLKDVGARVGMHKQSVHRIVKRWGSLVEGALARKPPFAPGDIICRGGKVFTVLESNHLDGALIDEKGRLRRNFKWGEGSIPKKIGVNPKYLILRSCPE